MPVGVLAVVVLVVSGLLTPSLAQSPADDERRLTLLVPAGAGGGTDALARRLALLLNEPLGMPVIVVNRPGRGGRDAIDALIGAEPDGRTLALLTGQAAGSLARPAAAVSPILLINLDAPTLHVRAEDDAEAAWAAVMAGGAQASGGPSGSFWHLALVELARADGRALPPSAWQPSARAASAIDRLARGELRLVVAEAAQAAAARRAGAITTVERPAEKPGLAGWRGLVGPPGLSEKHVEAIARAARLVAGSAPLRDFMRLRGFLPADLGPDAFASFLRAFARDLARARAALGRPPGRLAVP